MNAKNRLVLTAIGFTIWMTGTILYRSIGIYLFETSLATYWLNAIATGIVFSAVSFVLLKWQRIDRQDWLQGAICLALPGMLGEIPILFGFADLMTEMQPETAGRYAAFLFSGYSTLIAFAWLASIKYRSIDRLS